MTIEEIFQQILTTISNAPPNGRIFLSELTDGFRCQLIIEQVPEHWQDPSKLSDTLRELDD